ncbi:MAG: PadR family transcriptional regulator [Clostridiales bacterium]|nr:PadR family transcriptional regulator [Clostridiales bacterium]
MDIQLKRGLIEVCVLAALLGGESYGYALIKDISDCMEVSESTLYPILKRLENASMLTVSSREHNGRLRKYYSITPLGRARIDEFESDKREMTNVFNYIEKKKGEAANDKN